MATRQLLAAKPEERRYCDQHDRHAQVGLADHGGLLEQERLSLYLGQRCRVDVAQRAQDHDRADGRKQRRAERIEGLCQREPAVRGRCTPELRDQRVGGDLQHGNSGGQHEERQEKCCIDAGGRRRHEQQATCRHRSQTEHDAGQVPDPGDQVPCRQGHEEVRREESELRQHGLGIGQREQAFELGDQDVIETRQPAPDEEQRNDRKHERGRGLSRGIPVRQVFTGRRGRRG